MLNSGKAGGKLAISFSFLFCDCVTFPGEGVGTPYKGLYGEAQPDRGSFFRFLFPGLFQAGGTVEPHLTVTSLKRPPHHYGHCILSC